MKSIKLTSTQETLDFGREIAKGIQEGALLCFEGDLAAGKTTMIKGIVSAVMDYPIEQVNSPTFVYLNIYQGDRVVYHFDFYRLEDPEEFLAMGFDEYLEMENAICLIEWPQKIAPYLPKQYTQIQIDHLGETARQVTVEQYGL